MGFQGPQALTQQATQTPAQSGMRGENPQTQYQPSTLEMQEGSGLPGLTLTGLSTLHTGLAPHLSSIASAPRDIDPGSL